MILSDQYKSVFSPVRESYSDTTFEKQTKNRLCDMQLTVEKFQNAMRAIKISSAP